MSGERKMAELNLPQEYLEGLSPEEVAELKAAMQEEMGITIQGVDLKPVRLKIMKESQKFADPFDEVLKELKGVIVYKQKTRGYWPKGSGKVPECSSKDGITGVITETKEERTCASCPYNQWGTATDDAGNPTAGKACKEMRRLFIDLDSYDFPLMLSLPPTSIKEFDDYISARVTKGIPDILREVIISLRKEESHGFDYAVAEFDIGDKVSLERIRKLREQRKTIQKYAEQEEITQDDYMSGAEDVTEPESNVKLDDIS